jgi:UDP-N-acetylglucosamine acyltransferase
MSDVTVVREIASGAQIAPSASVGPWCVIGPKVTIGAGTRIAPRVTIMGRTTIGRDNVICSGAVLGGDPQDLKYLGKDTLLLIGDRNHIGNNVTAHIGTEVGGWVTYVGSDNRLDDTCHIAHDCYVADRTRIGRGVLLAGHIVVQTGAVIEDMVGIHHFTRVGRFSRVGPRTPVRRDVCPYSDFYSTDYYWDPPMIRGLHEPGIRAAGLGEVAEAQLREGLARLFAEGPTPLASRLDHVEANAAGDGELSGVCRFCRESLVGHSGRYREGFRNQMPPEAEQYLPPDIVALIRKEMSCQ